MIRSSQIWLWRWNRFLILLVFILLTACSSWKLTSGGDVKQSPVSLYNPGQNELHPDLLVYHSGVDESTLYFRLLVSELLFNQANPETRDQSRVKVSYTLYSSYAEKVVDQRAEKEFIINRDTVKNYYTGTVKFPTQEGISYLLEVMISDEIRQISSKRMLLVDRFNPKSQQNFLLVNYPGNTIPFERYFYANETFRIVSSEPPANSMRVAYYHPVNELPQLPYQTEPVIDSIAEPDSVWMIQTNGQNIYRLENEGIYLIYPDSDKMRGVYVTNFGRIYPQIATADQMILPLRYFATQDEYKNLLQSSQPKSAVDNFWLDKAGSFSAARELIRVYYNRVVFANLYFAADRPGYLTDRGMIYLLMGPPDLVDKSESGESWIYQLSQSKQKYSFDFNLVPDPVMAYRFKLKRTEEHRVPWNMALQSWRDGRIFSLK
jgi:GWxTD domain-containing protein